MAKIARWRSWGYCRPCNRLVHTTKDGYLAKHVVAAHWPGERVCEGTGQKEYELPEETDERTDPQ